MIIYPYIIYPDIFIVFPSLKDNNKVMGTMKDLILILDIEKK